MDTYSLRRSWGLAIDSSPPLWRPRFAIILQTEYGKERRNLLTGTTESSHAKGWVKGGDRHCPLLDC